MRIMDVNDENCVWNFVGNFLLEKNGGVFFGIDDFVLIIVNFINDFGGIEN